MHEMTIYATEKGGAVGAIGFRFPPCRSEQDAAMDYFIFRRGDTRVYVVVVTGQVTKEQCRQLAVAYYETQVVKIEFETLINNATGRFALSRKSATP